MPRVVFPDNLLTQPTAVRGPDFAGFKEAQERLRELAGVDATFLIAAAPTWPDGTPLDPETGRPYDPFLEPVDPQADAEIVVRASFVSKPLLSEDPAASPIGAQDRGGATLIVTPEDYAAVKGAYRVRVGSETWELQEWRNDIVGGMERWLAYLEHA